MNQQLVRFDVNTLNRALLGFDGMFGEIEDRLAHATNYPPFNILKHDNDVYSIEIAVTGFAKDEITVEVDQNQLVVRGERSETEVGVTCEYLHRGLASRNFVRSWTLAEHMIVGEASIKNGVLTINLTREVPEALKPRVLKIKGE